MLANLKVGTKLIVVLLAPVVVLASLALLGVNQRLDEAAAAGLSQSTAQLGDALVETVHALQVERMLTMVDVAELNAMPPETLAEQRGLTDSAVSHLSGLLAAAPNALNISSSSDLLTRVEQGRTELGELPDLRIRADGSQYSPSQVDDFYSALIDSLRNVHTGLRIVPTSYEVILNGSSVDLLDAMKEGEARAYGIAASLLTDPEADASLTMTDATELFVAADRQEQLFTETAPGQTIAGYRELLADSNFVAATNRVNALNSATEPDDLGVGEDYMAWVAAANTRMEGVLNIARDVYADLNTITGEAQADANRATQFFILAVLLAVVVAVAIALLVARTITRPLKRLTNAAYELSSERLPRLVESLKSNDPNLDLMAGFEPIDIDSSDEIGRLAVAFNAIQRTTVEVAEEQAELLRKGISDIFVNLARRNQSLLDRQIEYIDELESHEEDPDQLEYLFRLDHLATRMRRNSESLLVLASNDPGRRRGSAATVTDVVRVAIGEVEQFRRVMPVEMDEATVLAATAADLAHLLSEIMENATQFSPPETVVEVTGRRLLDGAYELQIADRGIGMTSEQAADFNELLANPPLVGLSLSRSLGFIVVGRLSTRHGVKVELRPSGGGSGTTAIIYLPSTVLADPPAAVPGLSSATQASMSDPVIDVDDPADADAEAFSPAAFDPITIEPDAPAVDEPAPWESEVADESFAGAFTEPEADPVAGPAPEAGAQTLSEALAEGEDFEAGLAALMEEPASGAPSGPFDPPPFAPTGEPFSADTGDIDPTAFGDGDGGTPADEPVAAPSARGSLASEAFAPAPEAPAFRSADPAPEAPAFRSVPEPAAAAPAPPAPAPAQPAPAFKPQVEPASSDASAFKPAPEPEAGALTSAGLVRRQPKAASASGEQQRTLIGQSQRSPEEIRKMLSRYRGGLNRGRSPGNTPSEDGQ